MPSPLGFVPTMGYLHEGHLSLVRRARQECGSVVVSIFVNPTQFSPEEDYGRYPKDEAQDLAMLTVEGVDVVFLPSAEEMYPPGFNSFIEPGEAAKQLEGACRPGHFRGVTTVVNRLFDIIQPDKAYFGQKDAQQAIVIRQMAEELSLPVEIIKMPIVREADGLAMSSRNSYLGTEERQAATVLHRALELGKTLWQQGETDAASLISKMQELINKEPLAVIDYISVANATTLEELKVIQPPCLILLAVKIGSTRLIDNVLLT